MQPGSLCCNQDLIQTGVILAVFALVLQSCFFFFFFFFFVNTHMIWIDRWGSNDVTKRIKSGLSTAQPESNIKSMIEKFLYIVEFHSDASTNIQLFTLQLYNSFQRQSTGFCSVDRSTLKGPSYCTSNHLKSFLISCRYKASYYSIAWTKWSTLYLIIELNTMCIT